MYSVLFRMSNVLFACRCVQVPKLVMHSEFGYDSFNEWLESGSKTRIIYVQKAWSFSTRLSLWLKHVKGANEMTQNEEKTPKSQKVQDRIIMAMIWIVAALVIALVLGTALNYMNIFK